MEQKKRTRELLILHYQTYPKLQIQDIFKFLYQSSFGCEHMISSIENVTNYIFTEYESICNHSESDVEQLDGDYCRVPLSYLNRGLSADTFGKLFFLSAKKEEKGRDNLIQKIKIAKEIVSENLLPFSKEEFEKAVEEWEEKGYPAVHHSEIFRESYQPSYRVIAKKYIKFLSLFAEIDQRMKKGNVTFAIEGGSAGGKTTLSGMLTDIYDCTLFHMDDFFLRPEQRTPQRFAEIGGNIDRERFLEEVLLPLSRGEIIKYRKFDCSSMNVGEKTEVIPKKLVVIEGAYSMHPEFREYYDFSVFLDISPRLQRERVLQRNPDMAERFFEQWIPLERKYFSGMNIKEQCDMQIIIAE